MSLKDKLKRADRLPTLIYWLINESFQVQLKLLIVSRQNRGSKGTANSDRDQSSAPVNV